MKQIPPKQIQCVEFFVDEVFVEVLSELFLIFPLCDVSMWLPSFQPTVIENNRHGTIVALCSPWVSRMFLKQHAYKHFPMHSNCQVAFVKTDSKGDIQCRLASFIHLWCPATIGTTCNAHFLLTYLSKLKLCVYSPMIRTKVQHT